MALIPKGYPYKLSCKKLKVEISKLGHKLDSIGSPDIGSPGANEAAHYITLIQWGHSTLQSRDTRFTTLTSIGIALLALVIAVFGAAQPS